MSTIHTFALDADEAVTREEYLSLTATPAVDTPAAPPLLRLVADLGDAPWREHAACLGADREIFFVAPISSCSSKGTLMASETRQRAVVDAYCVGCPVRAQCLEHALTYGEVGIWGDTEHARRAIRRSRRVAP
jgi:WhiB family redox-sensing transcriptional regulator